MNKRLGLCILSALLGGLAAVSGNTAYAATYDMTSSQYKNGITFNDPTENHGDWSSSEYYNYKYDKTTGTVEGGSINILSNKNHKQFTSVLQVSKSDLPDMSKNTVQKVLNGLVKKFTVPEGEKTSWGGINAPERNSVTVRIVDDVNSNSPKIYRSYSVTFTDPSTSKPIDKGTGFLGDYGGGIYSSTLENTDNPNSEYTLDDTGIFRFGGGDTTINVDTTDKTKDNAYAIVRSGSGKNVGFSNMTVGGGAMINSSLSGSVDASSHKDSSAYGVLNNTDSEVTMQSVQSTFSIAGDAAAYGIYAGGNDKGDSTVRMNGDFTFNLSGKSTTGLEANKNGKITDDITSTMKNQNQITISSPNGFGLYAHDGGNIILSNTPVNFQKTGSQSIRAEKGGTITLSNLSGNIQGISTDTDDSSKITFTTTGTLDSDLDGNIDAIINGGTWNGNVKSDKVSLTLTNNGSWNIKTPDNINISRLTGSDSAINRGFINVGKGNLTIGKYSGNGTFVYGHDEKDPSQLTGGNVTIKSAEPLKIISKGVGTSTPDESISNYVDSTITMATSTKGINMSDKAQINKVLQSLADKLLYSGYAAGERNLTGTLEIQEGLTSQAVSKAMADITWKDNGQASVGKTSYPYSTVITGDPDSDTEYAGVYHKDSQSYSFTGDTTIFRKAGNDALPDKWKSARSVYQGLITNFGSQWEHPSGWGMFPTISPSGGTTYTIDMNNHDLSVDMEAFPNAGTTGSQPMWTSSAIWAGREGTITFDNLGKTYLTTNVNYYYGSVIRASTSRGTENGAHVIFNNDKGTLADHAVVIRGGQNVAGYEINFRPLETYMNNYNTIKTAEDRYKRDNSIIIKGLADIEASTNSVLAFARGGYISIGGGRMYAPINNTMWTVGTGRIDMNVLTDKSGNVTGAGNNPVNIHGSISTATPFYGYGGTINIGLNTPDSTFTGFSYGKGEQNIWLQNGATWNNIPLSYRAWNAEKDTITDMSSTVTNLHGGTSLDKAGNILHTSANDLNIGALDGYVNIFMKHASNPADFSKSGNVIIGKAISSGDAKAHVRMITSALTMAELANDETVKNTLNALANKLYYTASTTGENNLDGTVEIAEGLTTASYVYRKGDIAFSGDKGQGSLAGNVTKELPSKNIPDPGNLPDNTRILNTAITGKSDSEQYYKDRSILKDDGIYTFTDDPTLIQVSSETANDGTMSITSAVSASDKDITIASPDAAVYYTASGAADRKAAALYAANGKNLNVSGKQVYIQGDGPVAAATGKGEKADINSNPDAILARDGAHVTVNKDKSGTITINKGNLESVNNGVIDISAGNGSTIGSAEDEDHYVNTFGDGTIQMDLEKGSTWTGANRNTDTHITLGGRWVQTSDSTVAELTGNGGTLDKSKENSGSTTIQNYSGNMKAAYRHDPYDPTNVYGGGISIGKVANGSTIDVYTDSKGLNLTDKSASSRKAVYNALEAVANKLHYDANDGNLAGTAFIAEGLTNAETRLNSGKIHFDKDGNGTFDIYSADDNTWQNNLIEDITRPTETAAMGTVKSAILGSAVMWRNNNNDLQRRMGDLRLGKEEAGIWARYIGGNNTYDKGNTYFCQDWSIGQIGYDRQAGDWRIGASLDYGTGREHLRNGRGTEKQMTLGLYGTRVSPDGKYFDIILKTGNVKNKFHGTLETIGNLNSEDYSAWGTSFSLEYGKRFVRDTGFYMDPSIEFTAGRLNGKNFKVHSSIGDMDVSQKGFNSVIGKVGFSLGRQLPKSTLYAKLALAHEFGGDFKTDYWANGVGQSTKVDLSDSWLELEAGGSLSLNRNTYLYGTFTKSYESDLTTKWRVDAGVRFTF